MEKFNKVNNSDLFLEIPSNTYTADLSTKSIILNYTSKKKRLKFSTGSQSIGIQKVKNLLSNI